MIMNRDDIILFLCRFKEMNRNKYSIIKTGLYGSQSGQDAALHLRISSSRKN
jgi:hypothetical protein